jgi:KaiC/GvpD/RAD55 family RecA-like ATPase
MSQYLVFVSNDISGKTMLAHPADDFADFARSKTTDLPVLPITLDAYHALPKAQQNTIKTKLPYIVPCVFPTSPWLGGRKNKHAGPCNLIILDVDDHGDAARLEQSGALNQALEGLSWFAYKTVSHTPAKPRMRIVISAHKIPPARYGDAVRTVAKRLGLKQVTPESLIPSQPMFIPSMFSGMDLDFDDPVIATRLDGMAFTEVEIQEGHTFASDAPAAAQDGDADEGSLEYLRAPLAGYTPAMVTEMLSKLDPDMKRDPWLRVAAALRHQFADDPEQGFEIFESWSATSKTKYVDSGPHSPKALWDSLESNPHDRQPVTLATVIQMAQENGWVAPRPKQQQATPEGSVKPFSFTHSSSTEPCLATFDFIENVLIDASSVVVYGPSNLGKTAFALDLAAQVARGGLYRDKLIVEQGAVLYVTLEGAKLFANRIEALKREGKLPDTAPFFWTAIEFNIMSDEDPRRLIETIKEVEREAGTSFKFVVIDTLARAMAGHDENSNEAMSQVAKNADRIQRATGSCVALIHHTGKDASKGGRGGYALKCAADTEIELSEGEDGKTVVTVTKQRELEKIPPWAFSLKVVTLGVNNRGRPVTACVIDHHSEPVALKEKANLFKKQKEPPTADSVFDLLPEGVTIKRTLFESETRRKLDSTVRDFKEVLNRLIVDGRVTEERVKTPSGQRANHVSRHSCPKGASEASTHGDFPRV